KNFKIFVKSDNSKVSNIDLAISQLINIELSKICPNIPIICEENELRDVGGDLFFLIDPIDGTSSFVNYSSEFCINIALIANNQPVFGLIYAPLFEGGKAIFSDQDDQIIKYDHQQKKLTKIHKTLNFSQQPKTLKIITSSRTKEADINLFLEQFFPNFIKNFSVEKLSSAIKFFKIIEGEANLYLHFRKSMEWDTASGDAILRKIGLKLSSIDFINGNFSMLDELQYKKNNFINNKFVVIAF
ncbi:MAG: hypothetical protein EBT63_06830, partial [Proteobacteria bacterium]|nr:hypothetical protein [Pseudomonadota bacterium]NCA28974.1 hypothetical protein [Pseudomonadota bacterium]